MNVRLFVRLSPLIGEAFQGALGIAVPELRAGIAPRRPLRENFDRSIQPDGDCASVEELASSSIDIGAAPCGDDPDIAFDEFSDEPSLTISKIVLAVALEHLGRGKSRGIFDCCVTVDERQTEPPGKAPPYR